MGADCRVTVGRLATPWARRRWTDVAQAVDRTQTAATQPVSAGFQGSRGMHDHARGHVRPCRWRHHIRTWRHIHTHIRHTHTLTHTHTHTRTHTYGYSVLLSARKGWPLFPLEPIRQIHTHAHVNMPNTYMPPPSCVHADDGGATRDVLLGLGAGLGNGTWTLPAGIKHCGQGRRGGYRTSRDEGSPTWGHVALRGRVSGGDMRGGTTGEWRDASRGTPD